MVGVEVRRRLPLRIQRLEHIWIRNSTRACTHEVTVEGAVFRANPFLLLLPLGRDAFGFGASSFFWQRFCGLDIKRAGKILETLRSPVLD